MPVPIYVKGDDPRYASERSLGQKAYRLLQLGFWSYAQDVYEVPNFSVVHAELSRSYFSEHGDPELVDYGPLPEANELDSSVKSYFEGFFDFGREMFDSARALVAGKSPIYIGSSLVMDTRGSLSFAGVNSRTTPTAVDGSASYVRSAVENALSGVYRPYAELYLRGHGLAERRRSSAIMFYEFIQADAEAVAYVHRGFAFVEWKPLKGAAEVSPPPAVFHLEEEQLWDGFWGVHERGERVRSAMRSIIAQAAGSADHIFEFEFCFADDKKLYFLQYRDYPASPFAPDSDESPILGTVGEIEGEPLSLVDETVALETVDLIRSRQGAVVSPIWLVNRLGPGWDAFRLMWIAEYFELSSLQLMLCHDSITHPLHVTSVLREDPRVAFFGEMPLEIARGLFGMPKVRVVGDGLRCRPVPVIG